jgi:hypothetical protein
MTFSSASFERRASHGPWREGKWQIPDRSWPTREHSDGSDVPVLAHDSLSRSGPALVFPDILLFPRSQSQSPPRASETWVQVLSCVLPKDKGGTREPSVWVPVFSSTCLASAKPRVQTAVHVRSEVPREPGSGRRASCGFLWRSGSGHTRLCSGEPGVAEPLPDLRSLRCGVGRPPPWGAWWLGC